VERNPYIAGFCVQGNISMQNRAFCAEKYEEKQREFPAWISMDFVSEMAKIICKCSINIAVNML
jgi:hypothetical protein